MTADNLRHGLRRATSPDIVRAFDETAFLISFTRLSNPAPCGIIETENYLWKRNRYMTTQDYRTCNRCVIFLSYFKPH